jgi:hypothetical protein
VAVADRPTGPYRYLGSTRPCGADSRDLTVFQEDDGAAWLITGLEWHSSVQFARLADDYLAPTGANTRHFRCAGPPAGRESPAVMKRAGRYYFLGSGTTGWAANAAEYAVASAIDGPWTVKGNPCVGPDADLTFHCQNTFFLRVHGKRDAWICMFDRWNNQNLQDSRYAWLPCEFSGEDLVIRWRDAWDLSIFADG